MKTLGTQPIPHTNQQQKSGGQLTFALTTKEGFTKSLLGRNEIPRVDNNIGTYFPSLN